MLLAQVNSSTASTLVLTVSIITISNDVWALAVVSFLMLAERKKPGAACEYTKMRMLSYLLGPLKGGASVK